MGMGAKGCLGMPHPSTPHGRDERGRGTETGWDRARKPFGPKQTTQYLPVV